MENLTVPTLLTREATAPVYGMPGDAGADLRNAEDGFWLAANSHRLVKTGVSVALPEGYAMFIHPRSGLALKRGITVLNAPGTIDAGYRGEIGVILHNTSSVAQHVDHGERIAQAVVQSYVHVDFTPVITLDETARGSGGFGSTGTI